MHGIADAGVAPSREVALVVVVGTGVGRCRRCHLISEYVSRI